MPKSLNTPAEQATLKNIKDVQAAGGDPFGDHDDAPGLSETEEAEAEAIAAAESARQKEGGTKPKPADKKESDADADDENAESESASDDEKDRAAEPTAEELAAAEAEIEAEEAAALAEKEEAEKLASAAAANAKPDQAQIDDDEPTIYRSPLDLQKERIEAEAAQDDSTEKLMAGDIDARQHSANMRAQQARLDKVLKEETKIETSREAYQAFENRVYRSIARDKRIDYANDADAAREFDAAMQAFRTTRKASDTFRKMAERAHALVLLARDMPIEPKGKDKPSKTSGKTAAEIAAEAKAAKAAEEERVQRLEAAKAKVLADRKKAAGKAPITLRGLPAASTPNSGGGLAESMANLSGPAFQEQFSKLNKAQREKLLN